MDFNSIKNLLPKRPKDSHKGTFGHVLNIAGSGVYSGAAYFSSIAPLKVGAGRSTLASIEPVIRAVSALSPDIILKPLCASARQTVSQNSVKELLLSVDNYDAISIGCGLSNTQDTKDLLKKFLEGMKQELVPIAIDADGLNILAGLGAISLPSNTILTPHPVELSRLMGVPASEIVEDGEYWVQKCSKKYHCITVLKTHNTLVCSKDGEIYVNTTGNSALSHGGSGDILCGMITGFLAQGVTPYEACILSVYLHGRTSEIASISLTEYCALSSDLLNYIHFAIKELI